MFGEVSSETGSGPAKDVAGVLLSNLTANVNATWDERMARAPESVTPVKGKPAKLPRIATE